jgi:hypothetical protein
MPDASVHILLDRIDAIDRERGLPRPKTYGHWVEAEIGQAIATGLREQCGPACCCAGWTSPMGSDGAPLMDDIASRALVSDPETRRALQLDTLSAILPMERRDRLAELLTDDDVETLKHLAREGMGENSLRALASDLAYLEAWALAATGAALLWPASESSRSASTGGPTRSTLPASSATPVLVRPS